MPDFWTLIEGDGPLVAAAVHDGHAVTAPAAAAYALDEPGRLREEDPFTADLAVVAPTRIVGRHSRFEVDLNRPRDGAVYRTPDDAWGLRVWKNGVPEDVARHSLAQYDAFYAAVREVLERKRARYGRVFVYDLHTYNHRREGPDGPAADPEANPEVNVGTGTMDRARWAPVVDALIGTLAEQQVQGHRLDVRENVKFRGGQFGRWIHEAFPESVCAPAIEFKKTFMDEWSGEPDRGHLAELRAALDATAGPVLRALDAL